MRVIWKDALGLPISPYMIRWGLEFRNWSIRLHKWIGGDDPRAVHDHAWWFFTIVVWGSYLDIDENGDADRLGFLSMRFRSATHRHTVQPIHTPTWTIIVTGRVVRRWAFFVNGKKYMRDKFFAVFGHHDPKGGEAVRMRPDGSIIS